MKGYSKFGDVGQDVSQWLQDLLIQFKKGLTPPKHPIRHRLLVYNKDSGLTDWVGLGTAFSIAGTTDPTLNVNTLSGAATLQFGWAPLTNGDLGNPQIVFVGGDVVVIPFQV